MRGNPIYLLIFFLLFQETAFCQNLVFNCDFETYINCPYDQGQIGLCESWISPGQGTTDYCNGCNSGTKYSVPVNSWGNQNARNGKAYAHTILYYPSQGNYREYIQTRLACPLKAGETYNVSFYISCSDRSRYAIDRIGAHFSEEPLTQQGTYYINLTSPPHIENTPGLILDDKVNWLMISGTYIADGGEEYLTIGNFFKNEETGSVTLPGSGFLSIGSYYIDEVSVTPVNPMLDLGNDTILCPGSSFTIDASLPCNAEYLWNDGLNDPSRIITEPGIYGLEVILGCFPVYDEIKIDFYEEPELGLPDDTLLCTGTTINLAAISGYEGYLWQDGSEGQAFLVTEPGVYWVSVQNDIGCVFDDTAYIQGISTPDFTLPEDTTLCFGTSLTLDPGINSPYIQYEWDDGSTGQQYTVTRPGWYSVTATNPCGTVSGQIYINYRNCNSEIFVPNAFTPNGDHLNDEFSPKGVNIGRFNMYVYDRWGTLLFQSSKMEDGWNGRHNGKECPAGVYVWTISYGNPENTADNSSETISGTVMLLR